MYLITESGNTRHGWCCSQDHKPGSGHFKPSIEFPLAQVCGNYTDVFVARNYRASEAVGRGRILIPRGSAGNCPSIEIRSVRRSEIKDKVSLYKKYIDYSSAEK